MKVSAINTASYVCKPNTCKHQNVSQPSMTNIQNQPTFQGKWKALFGGLAGAIVGFALGGPFGALGGAALVGGVGAAQDDKDEMDDYTRERISHYD